MGVGVLAVAHAMARHDSHEITGGFFVFKAVLFQSHGNMNKCCRKKADDLKKKCDVA